MCEQRRGARRSVVRRRGEGRSEKGQHSREGARRYMLLLSHATEQPQAYMPRGGTCGACGGIDALSARCFSSDRSAAISIGGRLCAHAWYHGTIACICVQRRATPLAANTSSLRACMQGHIHMGYRGTQAYICLMCDVHVGRARAFASRSTLEPIVLCKRATSSGVSALGTQQQLVPLSSQLARIKSRVGLLFGRTAESRSSRARSSVLTCRRVSFEL